MLSSQHTSLTVEWHLQGIKAAQEGLFTYIKGLEGAEKREAVTHALAHGYGASALAKGLGISRGRLYQLKEEK